MKPNASTADSTFFRARRDNVAARGNSPAWSGASRDCGDSPGSPLNREEFDLIKPRARALVAMGVLGLVPLGLVAAPAYSNTTVTGSCTDGGGIVWQTKVEWKGTYVRSGVTKVGVDYAGWSTNRGSTATDSIVRTYGPDGKLLNTQRLTATFDYKSGNAYDSRNPVNPPSSPGKSKVTITLGRDGDGFGNCTVTYIQPSTSADPVIAAVGDMVCKPGATVTSTACQHKAVSSSILKARPAAFLALGDLQYNNGELANFKTAYETSYGRFKASTRPAPGHEDNYQAQPKRNASGAESSIGVAQYIVGTGGKSVLGNASVADQKPIAFNSSTFGWLKVTLHSTSADLKFVPVGGSFTDRRTVTCNP